MSARRYFSCPDRSIVESSEHVADQSYYLNNPEWTEVQVVPLDAIVLEGPLPKVSRDKGRYVVEGDPGRYYLSADDTPASLRESARPQAARLFALAKYLEEHPPVDEAQVQAVAEALAAEDGAASGDWPDYRPRARRLVERGVRVGGDSDD